MKKRTLKKSDKSIFSHDLARYSATAGMLLSAGAVANGAIVYSGAKNISFNHGDARVPINMDGGSVYQFSIDNGGIYFASALGSWIAIVDNTSGANVAYVSSSSAQKVPAGGSIPSASMNWRTSISWAYLSKRVLPTSTSTTYSYGNFNGSKGYIAVKFQIAGNNHYGWIQYEGNGGASGGTIIDWAYEDQPDTPITAGQTSSGGGGGGDDEEDDGGTTTPHPVTGNSTQYFNTWRSRIEQLIGQQQ